MFAVQAEVFFRMRTVGTHEACVHGSHFGGRSLSREHKDFRFGVEAISGPCVKKQVQ